MARCDFQMDFDLSARVRSRREAKQRQKCVDQGIGVKNQFTHAKAPASCASVVVQPTIAPCARIIAMAAVLKCGK